MVFVKLILESLFDFFDCDCVFMLLVVFLCCVSLIVFFMLFILDMRFFLFFGLCLFVMRKMLKNVRR